MVRTSTLSSSRRSLLTPPFSCQVISTPSRDASLYIQQRDESERHLCQLATRKITVATIVGKGELTLRHHQLGRKEAPADSTSRSHTRSRLWCVSESEPPLSDQSERASEPGLISLLRAELGLSSPDLFSMTVTDLDVKPGVGVSPTEPGPNGFAP